MKSIESSRNVLSGLLSWLVPFLLALAVTPAIVHALGTERYGLYALIAGLSAYALGLTPAQPVIREVAAHQAAGRADRIGSVVSTATLLTLAIGLFVALGLAFGAVWVTTALLDVTPESRSAAVIALRVFAIAVPLAMLSQVFSAVLQGLKRFDLYGRIITSMAVLLLGGNALLAYAGAGLIALVVWSTSTAAIGCVAFLVIARRLLPGALFGRVLDWPAIQSLTRFGASVAARQTLGNLLLLFERVWIVRTLGASALTFYAVPMLVALSLHAFIASSALSFYPLASEAYARGDLEGMRVGYRRALKVAAPLIALPVVTLTVVGAPLLMLWMGPEFAERSATVLSIHAVTFGIVALMVVPWHTADALGRPGWNAALSLFWLLAGGVLMVWLTPRFGIVGAAAARLLGLAAVPFYGARIEKWLFGAVQWRFWARTLGLLALAGGGAGVLEMALLGVLAPGWNVAAAFVGGAIVFLGILRGLGYLEQDEREWLRLRVAALVGRAL